MLLGIHNMNKRLVRAVEAIPLHLSLGIVRLDDALGESWALPFQACLSEEVYAQFYLLNEYLTNFQRASKIFSELLFSLVLDLGHGGCFKISIFFVPQITV